MSDMQSKTVEEARADRAAVLLVDSAGNVLSADEVAERFLQRSADDICSFLVTDLFFGLVKENETLQSVLSEQKERIAVTRTDEDKASAWIVRLRRFLGRNSAPILLEFSPKEPFSVDDLFHQRILDSVDASMVVLDERGVIVYVNGRWVEFARENGGDLAKCGYGANYLNVCDLAGGPDAVEAGKLAEALREVLEDRQSAFYYTYSCHADRLQSWFQVRGRKFWYAGQKYIVISHESIDELMRTEQRSAMKTARLEDAARLANLGYFERRYGADSEIAWSPEMAVIMGYESTRTTVSVADFWRLVHPADMKLVNPESLRRALEKGPQHVEFRIVRPDGEVRWLHVIARAIVGVQGEVAGFFGVLRDITSDRLSLQNIERSQTQFRAIFELAQDGIAVIETDGTITMANPRFVEIFANAGQLMVGRRVYEFLDAYSADLVNHRFSARLRGEAVEPIVTLTLSNGKRCTIRTSLRQIAGADGVKKTILFATDLTEIISARSALDLTKDRFQRALEMTNTLVSDQDPDLRFVRVYNGQFYRDPIGKRDDELLPADCAEAIVKLKQSVIDTGKSARGDVKVIRGEMKSYFDLCVDPLIDENRRVSGITCVAVDITDRVKAEALRQEHNARMVAELEAKNKALEGARLEADQANIAKSRFLAMMSHEIRTPLNGVLGMTGVLLDMLQDSAQREIVETIRTSGDSLLTIINDILDFSKIEAGLMELEEHPFAIRHCLDDVIDLISPQARKKFIELVFVIAPDVPVGIWGDVTRLRQVLVNLIANAIKFTDAGEIVVELSVGQKLPDGGLMLQFAVRDTGIGIAAERIGRLFQTFSQVDVSINRKYGGTGLGLAICKRLVELMGGTIGVDSTPGIGTTFHFTFATKVASQVTSDVVEAISGVRRDLEGKRVLLVDDNVTARYVLTEQLRMMGLVPTAVSSAEEALEVLRREPEPRNAFAMVFIDLEMPEVNGYQLLSAIRSDARLLDLSLILLTASDSAAAQVRRRWQAPCLNKPVKMSTLFEAVMRVILDSPHISSHGPRSIPIDSSLGKRHPLRILLAEDNVINQKVALLLLERAGYRADVAANGREVLDAVTSKAYDVILMDVQMPEMDGLEATRRLRGPGPWIGKPRIVAMTADVMQEGREACVSAGMDDFVAKPIRIPELMRILEKTALQKTHETTSEDAWMAGTEAQLLSTDEVLVDATAFAALRSVCELESESALASLIAEFAVDSLRMLRELVALMPDGDIKSMERLAHTLKGTSGAFGAVGFSRLMETIERACREGKLQNVSALLEDALEEHPRLIRALEDLCTARVT